MANRSSDNSDKRNLPAEQPDAGNPYNIFAPGQEGKTFYCTIARDDPGRAWAIQKALDGDPDNFGEWLGKVFPAAHVLIHPWEKVDDKTGEVIRLPRMILMGPDGQMASCVSAGAVRSMQRIGETFGPPPWLPYLPLLLKQKALPEGRRMYQILVDEEQYKRLREGQTKAKAK